VSSERKNRLRERDGIFMMFAASTESGHKASAGHFNTQKGSTRDGWEPRMLLCPIELLFQCGGGAGALGVLTGLSKSQEVVDGTA
jgi:hypothetical protein